MKILYRLLLQTLLVVLPLVATAPDAQAERRVGVLMTADLPHYRAMHEAFVDELTRLNAGGEKIEFVLQRPFPDSISWSNAARKLIAFDVDLIVTYGAPATRAVLNEKSAIPLVYAGIFEPERAGLSGRNVTGTGFNVPLSSIVRYLKKIKTVNTLAVVCSGIEEDSLRQYEAVRELGAQQNFRVEKIDIRSRGDLGKLGNANWDAVFITGSSLAHMWLNDIVSMLRRARVPTADILPSASEDGVLITLGHPPQRQGGKAAELAMQIFRGKKAGSIAPQVLADTELVFNTIEARYIGISFPIQLLVEATRVIK